MLSVTDKKYAPWITVKSNDKKRGRLNAMRAYLNRFDYEGKEFEFSDRFKGHSIFVSSDHANYKTSLENLRTFPFVTEHEAAGQLELHGCHFAIADGKLYLLDEAENTFRPV